jgi:hypothetical protein
MLLAAAPARFQPMHQRILPLMLLVVAAGVAYVEANCRCGEKPCNGPMVMMISMSQAR